MDKNKKQPFSTKKFSIRICFWHAVKKDGNRTLTSLHLYRKNPIVRQYNDDIFHHLQKLTEKKPST